MLQRERLGVESPPDCGALCEVHGDIVSASPTHLGEVAQLVFGFPSEETVPYVALDLVSMGGGEFRILLCHHLEAEPWVVFFEWLVEREEDLQEKGKITLKVNKACAHFVKSVTFLGRKFEKSERDSGHTGWWFKLDSHLSILFLFAVMEV